MKRNKKFYKRKELRRKVKEINKFNRIPYYKFMGIGIGKGYEVYVTLNKLGQELLDKKNLIIALNLVSKPQYSETVEHNLKIRCSITNKINCTEALSQKEYNELPEELKYLFKKDTYYPDYFWEYYNKKWQRKPILIRYILDPYYIPFLELKVRRHRINKYAYYLTSKEEAEIKRKAIVTNLWNEASKEMGWRHHRKDHDSKKSRMNKILKIQARKDLEESLEKEEIQNGTDS